MNEERLREYLDWCAQKYLSTRPRSEFEIRRYIKGKLRQKRVKDKIKQEEYEEEVVGKLKERDLVNDKEFVDWYIKERQYFKPRGKRGLDYELRQKGISRDIIKSRLESIAIDESKHIGDILQKKFYSADFNNQKEKEKVISHLLRRGFAYGNIKKAIEESVESE